MVREKEGGKKKMRRMKERWMDKPTSDDIPEVNPATTSTIQDRSPPLKTIMIPSNVQDRI